jgi:hypothetical protein
MQDRDPGPAGEDQVGQPTTQKLPPTKITDPPPGEILAAPEEEAARQRAAEQAREEAPEPGRK